MYTECPNCNTVFRISPTELKAADGKVRCGRCQTVFSALASLMDELPADYNVTQADTEAAEEALAAEASDALDEELDALLNEAELEAPTTRAVGAEDLSDRATGLADLEELDLGNLDEDLLEQTLGETVAGDVEEAAPDLAAATEAAVEEMAGDEAAASEALEDLTLGETALKASPDEESIDLAAGQESLTELPDLSEPLSEAMTEQEAGAKASPDRYVLEELGGDKKAKKSGKLGSLFWSIMILGLSAVLVVQFAYFKRAELAKYPALVPALTALCAQINRFTPCEVPAPRDLDAIAFLERDVAVHPNQKNALLITAVMMNHAPFQQPYPDLKLRFSNIDGVTLADRVFKPREYLAPSIDVETGMAPEQPIRMMLELVDPGPEAVNFEFLFCGSQGCQ